ncbi:MAG: NAD(P)-binding domain-containing protein [Rubricoccaceae bacterium]
MTIAILGTGSVGTALGTAFSDAGHRVAYGSRQPRRNDVRQLAESTGNYAFAATPAEAAQAGEVVILATPWEATEALVKSLDLAGKTVLDTTNPLAWPELTDLASPSGGELVQVWAPKAHVVKAFCMVGADVMADPAFKGQVRPAMPVASNHPRAKRTAIELANQIGFEGLDVGGIERSKHLEHMAALWIHLARNGAGREIAFGLLRR